MPAAGTAGMVGTDGRGMPSQMNGRGPFLRAAGVPSKGHAPMPHALPPTRSAPLHEVGFPYDRRAPLRDGVRRSTDVLLQLGTGLGRACSSGLLESAS